MALSLSDIQGSLKAVDQGPEQGIEDDEGQGKDEAHLSVDPQGHLLGRHGGEGLAGLLLGGIPGRRSGSPILLVETYG